MSLATKEVLKLLAAFRGSNLTHTLSNIEHRIPGVSMDTSQSFLDEVGASKSVLHAAGEMKRLSSQIDVVIHALGILLCLPKILEPGEQVEYVSLGAGNTGRAFDLETDRRVAEFKFIQWRGGPESIRQNSIFKDFFLLQAEPTDKRKYLYLLGIEQPLKFFKGGRALTSVLSKDERVRDMFAEKHGKAFSRVHEYYNTHEKTVQIVDMSPWLPELSEIETIEEND